MNKPRSFEEVQTYLTQLENRISKLESQDIDLHGRKIVNAGAATTNTDYATLADVKNLIPVVPTVDSSTNVFSGLLIRGLNKAIKFLVPSATTSGRIFQPVADTFDISLNVSFNGVSFVQDDATKASWLIKITPASVVIFNSPAGGALAAVFTLTATSMGFFSAADATKQTLNAYTTNNQSFVYSATPASLVFAATLSDLNFLRAAYENLRLSYDDLRSKLKTTTLVG